MYTSLRINGSQHAFGFLGTFKSCDWYQESETDSGFVFLADVVSFAIVMHAACISLQIFLHFIIIHSFISFISERDWCLQAFASVNQMKIPTSTAERIQLNRDGGGHYARGRLQLRPVWSHSRVIRYILLMVWHLCDRRRYTLTRRGWSSNELMTILELIHDVGSQKINKQTNRRKDKIKKNKICWKCCNICCNSK